MVFVVGAASSVYQDHLCCDSAQDFMASNRGLTRYVIKNDSEDHIKDDRSPINDRTKYLLGWDTKLKERALIEKFKLLSLN